MVNIILKMCKCRYVRINHCFLVLVFKYNAYLIQVIYKCSLMHSSLLSRTTGLWKPLEVPFSIFLPYSPFPKASVIC